MENEEKNKKEPIPTEAELMSQRWAQKTASSGHMEFNPAEPPVNFMKIEELGQTEDTSLINRTIGFLTQRLAEIKKRKKEKMWLQTPEGKIWQAQEAERIEAAGRANKSALDREQLRVRKARRQLALDLFADHLLATKYKIVSEDPRLLPILQEQADLLQIVTAAYYK